MLSITAFFDPSILWLNGTSGEPLIRGVNVSPQTSLRDITGDGCYYFKTREQLVLDPGYVGSMQTALRRLGYYCGPIDGVFTPEVSRRHCARCKKIIPCV